MNGGSTASQDDDPLGPVVESFLDRFRRGERPALTDLIARHPDLAGPIRELIPALVELEQLGGATGSVSPPSRHPTGTRIAGDEGPPLDRLGDYVILRPIGGGGMGMVYEAEHESLKSRVALKVIQPRFRADPKYLRRFHAEARLAAGLHHTNIVSVFDYGEQDGVCYYAMQFIHSQPLDNVLADIGRLRDEGTHSDGPPNRDAIRTLAAAAPSPAMPSAVKGLFTGHFAAPPGPGAAVMASDASVPATVAVSALEPDPGGATQPIPAETSPDPPPGGEPSTLGSSSLGGSGELRYFREIARVGAQVADALDYAHRHGVLHRDIKPSNLLLDALGNVWVTDFGLAKLEEGDDLTQSRELVGTLHYMAPERFRGTSDRRCDIYSLGATLYELATLRPPFEESDQIRLIERIRNDAPAPPRQLDRNIPRDLETIILKALAKDPKDRFGSARELADELRRFVEGRPIRSRPVSVFERFVRWCRRDPWLAGANVAAALLTIVLALGSTVAAWVYHGQVVHIRRAETATRKNLFNALLAQARGTRFSGRAGQRFDSLKALREAARLAGELGLPPAEFDRLRDEAIACFALPDLEPTGSAIPQSPEVVGIAFDPTMTRSALRFRDGTVSVRDAADREIARFRAQGDRDSFILEFSPDGRSLATEDIPSRALRVWDVDRRTLIVTDPGPVWLQAPFRPDSRRILAGLGKLNEYDLPTGRFIRTWPGKLVRAAFRPDGALLAAIDDEPKPPACRIFEAESGRLVRSFSARTNVDYLAWSPGGRTLAMVGTDGKIDLWDAPTGIRRATLEGHDPGGVSAAFHPTGRLLASIGWDGRVRLWDPILGLPLLNLTGFGLLPFSRDGRILVSLGNSWTVYRAEPALEYRTFAQARREPTRYMGTAIHRDGRILAVGTDHGAMLWDLADGAELAFLPIGLAWSLLFDRSGDLITSGAIGVQRWPVRLDAGRGELRVGPPRRLPLPSSASQIAQDRSGRITAVAARRYAYVATPGRTFRVGPLDDCRYVAVSPDGRWLATGTHMTSRGAQVWRIADAARVADLSTDFGTGVRFTPDGKWLVAGAPRLRLWEVGTWLEQEPAAEIGASGSPDGRITVVVEPSRILRLVEFATGRTLARLESPDLCGVSAIAFSPDGSRLAVTTKDRPKPCVHVWDLRAIRKRLAGIGLDWNAPAYPEPDPAASGPHPPLMVAVDLGAFRGLDDETQALLRQAQGLEQAGKVGEALDALRRAVARAPNLAEARNSLAWLLATAPGPLRNPAEAIEHARRAVELAPDEPTYLNTYGVVLYRAGRLAEAVPILERSLAAGEGQYDAFDLFFLAMAHHRLGHRDEARRDFDRAVRWMREPRDLDAQQRRELAGFRSEAQAVLAGPAGELPEDVFVLAH